MRRQATGWNRGGSARPTTHIGSFCPLQATVSYFLEEEILVQAHAPALPKILHNSWTFSYDMGSRSSTILIERLPNLEGTRPDTAGTRRVICSLAQEGCLSFSCVSYTPVRKVLAQRKVLWKSPGGHRCTNSSGLILDPTTTPLDQSFSPPEVQ